MTNDVFIGSADWLLHYSNLVASSGFEPLTLRLSSECSTAELTGIGGEKSLTLLGQYQLDSNRSTLNCSQIANWWSPERCNTVR